MNSRERVLSAIAHQEPDRLPVFKPNIIQTYVKRVVDVLAPGGGYLFKAQAISRLIPFESLKAAYDLALEYGRYGKGCSAQP